MAKINQGYQSLFTYLKLDKISFNFNSKTKNRLSIRKSGYVIKNFNTQFSLDKRKQLLGSLQPIQDMTKDFADTFKPYKFARHIARDFLQPARGLGNILEGILHLVVTPLLFLGNTFKYLFISGSFAKFKINMEENSVRSLSYLITGLASILRGATQILTTTLAWFKMIVRLSITARQGWAKIEDNAGVKKLVEKGQVELNNSAKNNNPVIQNSMYPILCELHEKFTKAQEKKQRTDIEDELTKYSSAYANNAVKSEVEVYLNLFSSKNSNTVSSTSKDTQALRHTDYSRTGSSYVH